MADDFFDKDLFCLNFKLQKSWDETFRYLNFSHCRQALLDKFLIGYLL